MNEVKITCLRLVRLAEVLRRKAKQRRQDEMERLGVVQPKDHKLIPMLHGRFAKVDNDMFDAMSEVPWQACFGYATRQIRESGTKRNIWMHREIINCPSDMEVDHINGDRSDNRRSNLRICNHTQQQGNRWKSKHATTSRFKGVYFCKKLKKFSAYGRQGSKNKRLGTFSNEVEAAKEYDRWASKYFGEFAMLNFPAC